MEPRLGKKCYPFEGLPLKTEDLHTFELEKNINLSKEFKLFYLNFNGCSFINAHIYLDDKIPHFTYRLNGYFFIRLVSFFALENIDINWYPGQPSWDETELELYNSTPYSQWSLAVQEMHLRKKGWDPILWNQYLVIGEGDDSYILMGINSSNLGKIYHWDSDLDNIYDPIYLADSIPELLDKTEAMQTFNQK